MTVLEEAAKIVDGERRTLYGKPEDEFPRLAAMWSLILRTPVTAEQVCLCMIGAKLIRLSETPTHRDSQIDIAGYTRILENLCVDTKKSS